MNFSRVISNPRPTNPIYKFFVPFTWTDSRYL
jgi:hypothetical protein